MRRILPRSLTAALASLLLGATPWVAPARGQPPAPTSAPAPGPELDKRVNELDGEIEPHLYAGRIDQAVGPARRKLELLERALGKDHWRAGDARRDLETYRGLAGRSREVQDRFTKARKEREQADRAYDQGQPAETLRHLQVELAILRDILGEDHPYTATSCNDVAVSLNALGRYAESEAMFQRALGIKLRVLGEDHPSTAATYDNRAVNLARLTRYAESAEMERRSLEIRRKALGEDHPDTGISYNNLAGILGRQGKYAEAEATYRRALVARLRALGEDHPYTAIVYSSLGAILGEQGKSAEAEAMHRRGLAIRLRTLGEDHPETAGSYSDLALTLDAQGRYAEAEAMHRRGLAIRLKTGGEDDPETATTYNYMGKTLLSEGRSAEAEAIFRRALAIRVRALGEEHPETAVSYNNLGLILDKLGRPAEAEAMHRRSMAIGLKVLGPDHPHNATSYSNLAASLEAQGKPAEAEALYRRALALFTGPGEGHPYAATIHGRLASCLARQGRHEEALGAWTAAASSYEQARLRRAKGHDAALAEAASPLPFLALALARAGRPRDAWTRWEQGLSRGLNDEVIGRASRPLTGDEREREVSLLGQAQALDERIGKLLQIRARTGEQDKLLDELHRQRSDQRGRVLELERQFENKYGALAGRPATLDAASKAIPEGTALLGWIDQEADHWACLLRPPGDPIWVRITGSGEAGAWTHEEGERTRRLRDELNPETTRGNARPLAEAISRQRLEPLKASLTGVTRLVVVNSPGLAGVPVEVLMAARPDPAWDGMTVSYVPSASMFVHLVGKPIPSGRAPTLLALADPAYPEARNDALAPAPPDAGLAIAVVVPNGNADVNGIQVGDVLISYAGTSLTKPGDFKPISAAAGPKKVPVRYWREGIIREAEVAAGPLGVAIDPRPATAFVTSRRDAARVLVGMRAEPNRRLPGTRREVEAIAALFPAGAVTAVMGEQASESSIQSLARSGRMRDYRYLHFATHGRSDPRNAYRSALLLAPDPDRSADPAAPENDGAITAEQIARTWELDADLVVLSACESGLGRAAGGEGYLGFAQPLLAKGARGLVLSLWKVDDDATALLMARFYRNLLGKREGLKAPLNKAEALAEAKQWLRGAGMADVGAALAALPRGSIVRRQSVAPKATAHPYEEPTYWAAFTLIGAPD